MSAADAAHWRALVTAAQSGTGTDSEDAARWQQFLAGLPPATRNVFEAAQHWQDLCEKVRHCLLDSPNGFASIYGGDDNLFAQVQFQCRGHSGVQVTLSYTAENNIREDLDAVVRQARQASS